MCVYMCVCACVRVCVRVHVAFTATTMYIVCVHVRVHTQRMSHVHTHIAGVHICRMKACEKISSYQHSITMQIGSWACGTIGML